MTDNRKPNRLINEKSPYLLQHAYNPVDWYPWSQEAFDKARQEDKPVFLSIGYSTCHWCHVMERESFEDEEVAQALNQNFVSIKVDREERPDIDHIYMTVCQAMTGHGGWPLNVFLTPERKPFYAGTYFPKNDRMGIPGLLTVLDRVVHTWKNDRDKLVQSSNQIAEIFNEPVNVPDQELTEDMIHRAYSSLKYNFDSRYGGFGKAPKFPSPHNLLFLLRYWYRYKESHALEMVKKTLDSMYRGGIYDHIGFGFSRYSTDHKWLVPHFEKMLYDNALLAIAYIEAYMVTKKASYKAAADEIFTYVLRDMTSSEGGFYSAEDADSEGKEGKFYIWSRNEIMEILGEQDGDRFCSLFDITSKGNFEGYNILNLIKSSYTEDDKNFVDKCRQKLFHQREKRVHPHKDDKILTSWNGLMIAALAIGGRVLGKEKYSLAAEKAVSFIFSELIGNGGRLMARYRDGEAAYPGYVDDYAFLIWGLTELFETTYKHQYLKKALDLSNDLIRLFWDDDAGGLFIYGSDSEQLFVRPKDAYDGATPSGNSVAAMSFLKLARITGEDHLEEKAYYILKAFSTNMQSVPQGYLYLLTAMLYYLSPSKEIILAGERTSDDIKQMVESLRNVFLPFTVSVLHSDEEYDGLKEVIPFITNYKTVGGKAAAYICENFTCHSPVTDKTEFMKMLH